MTMAATAIAGHNKHGMISTVKGLYLYLPVCATIAQRATKTNSKFVCVQQTGREASTSLPQTDPS
jgi:hypothetical protein